MAKSSDIISIAVGETWRHAGMVSKASGSAITSGTVNYYIKAKSGANAGKWWKNSDQTWAAVETANAMTHDADGNWTIELAASPFIEDVIYLEYAKESGDLHVAGEGRLLRGVGYSGGDYTQTVTVTTGTPAVAVQNAAVYIMDGATIVDKQPTNVSGIATPSADAGTYTLKVVKSGYTTNSASITVTVAVARAVTLTAVSSTESTDPDSVTVRWRVKKANREWAGAAQATVYIQILEGPGTDGIIWHGDNTDFDSDTTDASGYVEFTNVPIPCTLGVRTGTGRQLKTVVIPATATSPYDAGELISLDA